MGQDVRNDSRVCRAPPGPPKDLNQLLRPRTIFMAVSLTLILTTTGLVVLQPPPAIPPPPPPAPLQLTPHAVIAIDGDADFSDMALLEGWPGDGSSENPYIIDRLEIVRAGDVWVSGISISNTRVNFTISNCNLTVAGAIFNDWIVMGILLENVTNAELVNNICNYNRYGIYLGGSDSNTVENNTCSSNVMTGISLGGSNNTVANNTCTNNGVGISLSGSNNTVANNTCTNNGVGIGLSDSYNTVTNNICNNNTIGIYLEDSWSNTVTDNSCTNNRIGIYLEDSWSNTVTDNSCTNNRIGIFLSLSGSNMVANNIFSGNIEHDIVDQSELDDLAHKEFVAREFAWLLGGLGMTLVVSVIVFVQFRRMEL